MKAVLRLIWTYFTATRLMRGLVVPGLVLSGAGMVGYLYYPPWTLGTGMRSSPLWLQSVVLVAPWLGLILLFFASSLLPVIIERVAFGRMVLILPRARVALLISAVATAGFIAVLTALTGVFAFYYYPNEIKPERIFSRALLVVFSDVSLMYVALWIVGKARGIWLLIGSLLIAFGILTPLSLIGLPSGVPAIVWVGIGGWVAFALLLLFGGRLKQRLARPLAGFARLARRVLPRAAYASGTEFPLLLGTNQPWLVALGQAIPVVVAAWLFRQHTVWLFFLTLFSAIGGAITSTAAARSRVLWLRNAWTRAELFRRVETAYWRYNAYPLGVLLLLYVAIGSYLEISTARLAFGVPLLALGSVASLYLGLMMTRGLRWFEGALGVVTMGLLMWTAVTIGGTPSGSLIGETLDRINVIELEVALAALALIYRTIASARWNTLDWMVCRNGPATRAAG
ncbi:MAG: hypothetical protein ABI640_01220 [Gammaproteobacteria bacterium]